MGFGRRFCHYRHSETGLAMRPSNSTAVLDHEQLSDACMDDQALMRELVASLIDDTTLQLIALHNAIEHDDRGECQRVAHYVKGGLRQPRRGFHGFRTAEHRAASSPGGLCGMPRYPRGVALRIAEATLRSHIPLGRSGHVKVDDMRALLCVLLSAVSLFASGELSNRRAPGFSLPDLNLKQYDTQDYRGKILIVEIMQTTCPHCAAFSAILEEAVAKYGGRVAVLSLTLPPDKIDDVKRYIAKNKITVPILFDSGQAAASYLKAGPQSGAISVPHVFLIDAQGMIRNDYEYSPLTKDIFEGKGLFAELDRMLAPAKSK
jgi:peroxiredoxin